MNIKDYKILLIPILVLCNIVSCKHQDKRMTSDSDKVTQTAYEMASPERRAYMEAHFRNAVQHGDVRLHVISKYILETGIPVLSALYELMDKLSNRQLYDKRDPGNHIEIPQFDAWHQFTVINPMRFLGLIDESSGEMKVKTERLKKLRDTAIEFAEDDNWCDEACALGIEKESVEQSAQEIIDQFERMPLHSAEDIFRANRGRQC